MKTYNEYLKRHLIIQRLIESHTFLGESWWVKMMSFTGEWELPYNELIEKMDESSIGFYFIWEKGMFLMKKKSKTFLFKNFKIYNEFIYSSFRYGKSHWILCP